MSKYLFEGDFKRRPTQKLGGNSKLAETREQTIQHAEFQRNMRGQERARAAAVLVLQAAFRGMRDRRIWKIKVEHVYTFHLSTHYSIETLEGQMTRLNYFFKPQYDVQTLCDLGRAMILSQDRLIANMLTDTRSVLRVRSILEKSLTIFSEPSQKSRAVVLRLLESFTDWNKVEHARRTVTPHLDSSKSDDVVTSVWCYLVLHNNFFDIYKNFLISRLEVNDSDSAKNAIQHYDFTVFYQRFLQVIRRVSLTSRNFCLSNAIKDSKFKRIYTSKELVQVLLLQLAKSLSSAIISNKAPRQCHGVLEFLIWPCVAKELSVEENQRCLWTDEWLNVVDLLTNELTTSDDKNTSSLTRPVMLSFLVMLQHSEGYYNQPENVLTILNSLMSTIDNRKLMFVETYEDDDDDIVDDMGDSPMRDSTEIEMTNDFFSDRLRIYQEIQVVLNNMKLNQWIAEFSPGKWNLLNPVISCLLGIEPRLAALHFRFLPTLANNRGFMRSLCNHVIKKEARNKDELVVFCWLISHLMSILHDGEYLHNIPLNRDELLTFISLLVELYTDIILGDKDISDPLTNFVKKGIANALISIHDRNTRMEVYSEDVFLSTKFGVIFPMETHGIRFKDFDVNRRHDTTLQLLDQRLLRVLIDFPFALTFHDRVSIWHQMIRLDHFDRQITESALGRQHIQIRRTYIYEDAYEKLSPENVPDLRSDVRISLVNVVGVQEAGVDGGGLLREFLTEATKAGVDPNRGLFRVDSQNRIYPNSVAKKIFPDYRKHFFLMGRLVGKALYRQILVELPLAAFFLQLCAFGSVSSAVDYLATLDPDLHKNLLILRNFKGDLSELGLDFTIAVEELGETRIVDLKADGRNIVVDANNVIEYIHLVADYKINREMADECKCFRLGLFDVVPILRIFSWREMQTLISGSDKPIDVQDWETNTNYGGGYSATHKTIEMFWEVVENFDESHLRKLLKFVTSCSRPPLLGFKDLVPKFGISNAGITDRLPTAATCMNLLKLPEFADIETLRERLVYAINAQAGFELS